MADDVTTGAHGASVPLNTTFAYRERGSKKFARGMLTPDRAAAVTLINAFEFDADGDAVASTDSGQRNQEEDVTEYGGIYLGIDWTRTGAGTTTDPGLRVVVEEKVGSTWRPLNVMPANAIYMRRTAIGASNGSVRSEGLPIQLNVTIYRVRVEVSTTGFDSTHKIQVTVVAVPMNRVP
jgi:hypothetical protein